MRRHTYMDKPHPRFRAFICGGKSVAYMLVFMVVIRMQDNKKTLSKPERH